MPTYSLVVPAYNEKGVIEELSARLVELMDALDAEAEAILVDDGSRDRTYEHGRSDDSGHAVELWRYGDEAVHEPEQRHGAGQRLLEPGPEGQAGVRALGRGRRQGRGARASGRQDRRDADHRPVPRFRWLGEQRRHLRHKAGTPWSTALPAGGVAKCVKITGLAIKAGHKAKIDVHVDFRPTDTDWPLSANPQLYFRAGFNFKLTKTVTYGLFSPSPTNYSSTDNIDTVGVGKKVTAVGGFAFQGASAPAPGGPATGYTVRPFNSPSDAGTSLLPPFRTCSAPAVGCATVDADGFYFIQATGLNDPNNPSTPNLPSGVQYYVQVCDLAGNPVIATLVDHKLADKEFVEWDLNASPAVPKPLSLAIKHGDGKPSNGDTVVVNWTEPLAEVTMCSNWGYDNTKDQTLSGVTVRIADGGAGNDKLTVVNNTSLCAGGMHFGTIDLGSPNYVTTDQNFTSSKIAWNHNGTLTFTLSGSATTSAVTASITAYYYPDPAMTDTSGNFTPTGVFASDPSSGSTSNF